MNMYKFERRNMKYKIPYVDGLGIDEKDRFILLKNVRRSLTNK